MSQFLEAMDKFTLPTFAEVIERTKQWVLRQGPWWMASMFGHMLILVILGLLLGRMKITKVSNETPIFDTVVDEAPPTAELTKFELGDAPLEPTVLDTESLLMTEPTDVGETASTPGELNEGGGGAFTSGEDTGYGLGGFDFLASGDGPAQRGAGGVGRGVGAGKGAGKDGEGGFAGRGARTGLGGGGTRATERAVAAALNWIARHQSRDGSWSIHDYGRQCKDNTCTGQGASHSDTAATAMGLLPFFAAGQTHKNSKSPYAKTINGGLAFLIHQQAQNGNLANGQYTMYAHGLATIALSEAYGLTNDPHVGKAAQAAVHFIEYAQHPSTGGWRYSPGEEGDTSVVGWQVMALKSAQMAGLQVNTTTLAGAQTFLKKASSGAGGGLFAYVPGGGPTPTMSAVGLLCNQYLGTRRESPVMVEGVDYLMHNLPTRESRSIYYWYYATQVMHNLPGTQWDEWNRLMRRVLIESQVKGGCAEGSWDPERPYPDPWGNAGGRLMMTSLSCLTLEVYYRYLPLYKLAEKGQPNPPGE